MPSNNPSKCERVKRVAVTADLHHGLLGGFDFSWDFPCPLQQPPCVADSAVAKPLSNRMCERNRGRVGGT
jgi:hypothetical protein